MNNQARNPKKRPNESLDVITRYKKQLFPKSEDDALEKVYEFRILLPNGCSVSVKLRESTNQISVQELIDRARKEYLRLINDTEVSKPKRQIDWSTSDIYFLDDCDNKLRKSVDLRRFLPNRPYILRLHDGKREADVYENMWDLTPDTQLLKELPEEYTFETALADLIDNSLQAVWSNGTNKRRLISVEVTKDKISIFDTGPGMDGSEENSLVKWGKMGASLHRLSREKAIGGRPPYLKPVFGMFGYGGFIASMHLGRHTEVSSKTTVSKKVHFLRLKRDVLLSNSGSERTWRTDGGLRDPSEDETKKAPDGSFTKVDIFEPKMRSLGKLLLQCKLKDIYFPYIQCDELLKTGKTTMPIKFQVNDIDLAEIEGGEVAITNLHSCNGPEFVLQLRFLINQDKAATNSLGTRAFQEANARLRCVYLPVIQGKESIEKILEKLEADGYGITEKFESFSRVSVRRLGRLLPDARWAWLPFMDFRLRKGDRAQILKRCCARVKCFIDTDAGFNPTPSKTDLAQKNPYTTALKNFGNKQPLHKYGDVEIEIRRDAKPLTLSQLDKQLQEWILKMHELYDEEVDSGMDEPVIIVNPSNKKELRISMNVVRVHKVFLRKGRPWKSGQKIKVIKGAYQGSNKNQYFTLEYILLEGFQGDAGGEAWLICRPLSVTEENGCLLASDNGNPSLNLQQSTLLPVNIIDNGKCLAIEGDEWNNQLEKQNEKSPSSIEILSARHCRELGIEVALPTEDEVLAGHVPPKEVVAVVRPASFNFRSATMNLDQKYILKDNFEMALEIKFMAEDKKPKKENHIYSVRTEPSSRKGFSGLYVFQPKSKSGPLFQRAGLYTFSFSLRESSCRNCVKKVQVKGLSEVQRWELLEIEKISHCCLRVGSCFPPFSISCYDRYDNRIPFTKVPKIVVEVSSEMGMLAQIEQLKVSKSVDKLCLRVEDLFIESYELDKIRPGYEATLMISSPHQSNSLHIPFQVIPGCVDRVIAQPTNFEKQLIPGHVINELVLEMFDAYGNHVKEDEEILLRVNGFHFQDKVADLRKVDDRGCVDLGGLLKVTMGYGKSVSFSVLSNQKVVFSKEFQIEKRELRTTTMMPEKCVAGSQLENVVFEIVNSRGDVDVNIHDDEKLGQSHILTLKSQSKNIDDSIKYVFCNGRCVVRAILLPEKEGIFSFVATHSRYPDLQLTIKMHLEPVPEMEHHNCQPLSFDGNILSLPDSPAFKTPKLVEHHNRQPLPFNGNILPLPDSPAFMTPKLEFDDVRHQVPGGFLDSSSATDVGILVVSLMNDQKKLEDDVVNCGLVFGDLEQRLEVLQTQKMAIEQDLSELQVARKLVLSDARCDSHGQTVIVDRIESRTNCAAAVVCNIFKHIPDQDYNNDFGERIIGVVALLGTVQTIELSRILAEYLGDQILAVVCKSYDDIGLLEKYDYNGNLDRDVPFHKLATAVGKAINGRYLVLCLENIRPYSSVRVSDPQRKLLLPDPTLPDGSTPAGFLGYAVNMIDVDIDHLHTKTDAGYGLRETLFYRLFGELQVYKSREYMKMAAPCIEEPGAVSLDGGIVRANGAISLGCWEPDIQFPVVASESQVLSPHGMEVLKQCKAKKLKLRETIADIDEVTKNLKTVKKSFDKKSSRWKKFLDEKGPVFNSLEYKPIMDSS